MADMEQHTMSLEASVAGFVAGPFAVWANCTLLFFGVFGASALGLGVPANGGRHTTQYMICRWANGARDFFSVETGSATREGKKT